MRRGGGAASCGVLPSSISTCCPAASALRRDWPFGLLAGGPPPLLPASAGFLVCFFLSSAMSQSPVSGAHTGSRFPRIDDYFLPVGPRSVPLPTATRCLRPLTSANFTRVPLPVVGSSGITLLR